MPWRVDCPPGNPRALSLGSWHLHNVHADLAHAPCEELNLIPWPTESEPDPWHALSSNNGYIYADELKTFKDNLAKERETPCTPVVEVKTKCMQSCSPPKPACRCQKPQGSPLPHAVNCVGRKAPKCCISPHVSDNAGCELE